MIAETLAKFVLGFIFAFCYIRIFNLHKKTILYFILLPGFIFVPNFKILVLSLSIGLLLGLIYKRSVKFFPVFLLFILVTFFIFRPPLNVFSDQGTLNVINSQRGEDILIYQNQLLAKLLHNKASYIFTYLSNLGNYFTPVRLFAGALYPTISQYYPLGLLFPWDIILLVIFFKETKKRSLAVLASVVLLILPVGMSGQGDFGFVMALSLSFFLATLVAEVIGGLAKTKYFLLIFLMFIYTASNILTIGPFIGK